MKSSPDISGSSVLDSRGQQFAISSVFDRDSYVCIVHFFISEFCGECLWKVILLFKLNLLSEANAVYLPR